MYLDPPNESGGVFPDFIVFLLSFSSFVASALSSADTFRPMNPNQAKKLKPPIPVLSICFLNAFCSGDKPVALSFPLEDCSASQALQTISSNPLVKSRSFFQWILTGSLTNPVHPSFDRRYQNFFSKLLSSKYSFESKSHRIDTDRGSPSSWSISNRETKIEVKEERRTAESEGWMYWSMSGGACSRTKGQKFSIWRTRFSRRS